MPETIAFENPIEDDAENGSDDDGDDDTTSVENPLQVELENTDAERVARLKEIFKELDEDGSGAVGIEELKRGLIKTKIIRSKLAAGELFHKADTNGDMVIDLEEFLAVAKEYQLSEDEQEEAELEAMYRAEWFGVLHPDTAVRGVYDMIQLTIMLYLAWLLPTRFAFQTGANGALEVAMDLVIDLSVWVDMVLQRRMYNYDSKTKKLMTDREAIKKGYMRGWFVIDFFSVVPADQVLFLTGSLILNNTTSEQGVEWGYRIIEYSVTARLMRLLRLVRLAKIGQLMKVDKVVHNLYLLLKRANITKLQVSFFFRIFFLVALILLAGHFLGCIWLLLGRGSVLNEQNPTGWMVSAYDQGTINTTKDFVSCIGGGFNDKDWNSKHGSTCEANYKPGDQPCAPIPKEMPYDVDCSWIKDRATSLGGTGFADGVGASQDEQYLSAFYFSLVTVTSVGYGDILPETEEEKSFVVWSIMIGAFLYAYIIGDFSNLLKNLSQERDKFDEKMRSVNDLLGYIDAAPDIRAKVQDFYDFKFASKQGSASIINELPLAIQIELIQQRYGSLISKVPFFATLHEHAVVELCRAMVNFTVSPGDFILEKGEYNSDLLILSKGTARTPGRGEDGTFTTFDVGAFWGEMEFLGLTQKRQISVVADLYCEVAAIHTESIVPGTPAHRNLSAYGTMRQEMQRQAAAGESVDMEQLKAEFDRAVGSDADDEDGNTSSYSMAEKPSDNPVDNPEVLSILTQMQNDSRKMDRQRVDLVKSVDEMEKLLTAVQRNMARSE